MRSPKTYFIYIMSNRSKTLSAGVTNNLIRRVREHKLGLARALPRNTRLTGSFISNGSRMFITRLSAKR
jgi:predicted GIY-YIG superfamily endonuclease